MSINAIKPPVQPGVNLMKSGVMQIPTSEQLDKLFAERDTSRNTDQDGDVSIARRSGAARIHLELM